jgi:hypothetical protein
LIATADARLDLNDNGEYAGKPGTLYPLDCNGEYAGKHGTPYQDWHTTPRNAPRAVRGDDR